MKHLHSFQSSAAGTEGWDAQAEVSWGWWQQGRVMGVLCATPAWQHSSPPSASDQSHRALVLRSCCSRRCAGTLLPSLCPPHALALYSGFYRPGSPQDTSICPTCSAWCPQHGVAALERALDHNPAWPPSSIATNLFLHPVPTYQICSHPINQPSPVSCMEGWYLRSLLHHSALRHNYTPLKCTQHLLHHERCTKNMIREG